MNGPRDEAPGERGSTGEPRSPVEGRPVGFSTAAKSADPLESS